MHSWYSTGQWQREPPRGGQGAFCTDPSLSCQLLHPTGCRARREGSRQGQGSQGKEMKTSPFNINCMFSCPCLIYTPRFCLLSEQQCLSCRAQPSAAASDFSVLCLNIISGVCFPYKTIEQPTRKRSRRAPCRPSAPRGHPLVPPAAKPLLEGLVV